MKKKCHTKKKNLSYLTLGPDTKFPGIVNSRIIRRSSRYDNNKGHAYKYINRSSFDAYQYTKMLQKFLGSEGRKARNTTETRSRNKLATFGGTLTQFTQVRGMLITFPHAFEIFFSTHSLLHKVRGGLPATCENSPSGPFQLFGGLTSTVGRQDTPPNSTNFSVFFPISENPPIQHQKQTFQNQLRKKCSPTFFSQTHSEKKRKPKLCEK